MAVKTWATADYGQRGGGFVTRIVHEDEMGRWRTIAMCPHRNYEHANCAEALACGREMLTCYHCSQTVDGAIVWDAGMAFHPQCAAALSGDE